MFYRSEFICKLQEVINRLEYTGTARNRYILQSTHFAGIFLNCRHKSAVEKYYFQVLAALKNNQDVGTGLDPDTYSDLRLDLVSYEMKKDPKPCSYLDSYLIESAIRYVLKQ